MKDLSLNDLQIVDKGTNGLEIYFGVELTGEISHDESERLEEWLTEKNTESRITKAVRDPNNPLF